MISNVACFCCNIISFIIIMYSTIYRDNTVTLGWEGAALYVYWMGMYVLGLSLAAGQAVILNHKVSESKCFHDYVDHQ